MYARPQVVCLQSQQCINYDTDVWQWVLGRNYPKNFPRFIPGCVQEASVQRLVPVTTLHHTSFSLSLSFLHLSPHTYRPHYNDVHWPTCKCHPLHPCQTHTQPHRHTNTDLAHNPITHQNNQLGRWYHIFSLHGAGWAHKSNVTWKNLHVNICRERERDMTPISGTMGPHVLHSLAGKTAEIWYTHTQIHTGIWNVGSGVGSDSYCLCNI